MDAFRYYLALALVVFMPPLILYWCLLHPWVRFWRRLGPTLAMTLLWSLVALAMAGLFALRGSLLAVHTGTHPALWIAGIACLITAAWLRRQLARHFSARAMSGLPELAPDRYPQPLVTQGLYARVRHPRYLQLGLALLGWALIANHPAAYATSALWIPGIWIITTLEEKELRQRFGPRYEEYCRRVPRFLPRRRR